MQAPIEDSYALSSTVLVLVDFERGVLMRPDGTYHPWGAESAHHAAARAATRARRLGIPVVLVRVERREDYADITDYVTDAVLEGKSPSNRAVRRLQEGSADVDFLPPLVPEAGDFVVVKRRVSAFYGTPLDIYLRRLGARTLLMGGVYTDLGVESTARDAFDRDFQLVFLKDACASAFPRSHDHALVELFPRIGRVRTVDEVFSHLEWTRAQ